MGPGQHRVRNGLVVAEVSMALVLLVGAGLMLRSFYRVLHADAGFSSEGLVIGQRRAAPDRLQRAREAGRALRARARRARGASPA